MDNFETYIPCDTAHELQVEKKHLSKVFWAMFISWLVSTVILTVAEGVIYFIAPEIIENQWIMVGINGFYTILCVCIFALFGHGREKSKHPVTARMTPSVFFRYILIAYGIMTIGSFIGVIVSSLAGLTLGKELENAIDTMVENMDYGALILSVIVLAPVFEELLFRKLLIDSIARYGTLFSVVVSGLTFAVFHGNFYQFFYAFGLGALLAYVYCIYGKLRYTIIFHAIINFFGGVLPVILEDIKALGLDLMMIYTVIYYIVSLVGIGFMIADMRWYRFYCVQGVLVSPFKALVNAGAVALAILGMLMFVVSIFIV